MNLPLIDIVEETYRKAQQLELQKIGLLGTLKINTDVFPDHQLYSEERR